MLHFILDITSFGFKVALVTGASVLIIGFLISQFRRDQGAGFGSLTVLSLSEHYREMRMQLLRAVTPSKEFKALLKAEKRAQEGRETERKRGYVIRFDGDLAATAVSELREQVSALLAVLRAGDEVVLLLESSGGLVHDYGLAAAQLARLREAGFRLTICVDKVAASGGYMMACVADQILAAPFAVIGSVGVLVMVPNFNRLLKKFDIDYLELAAGEYKHTLSTLGEITEKGRAKSVEELNTTHQLFKDFIRRYRPDLDVDRIATGEVWYGLGALELKLVDTLRTSDDYLIEMIRDCDLYRLEYEAEKTLRERITSVLSSSAEQTLSRLWAKLERRRHPGGA